MCIRDRQYVPPFELPYHVDIMEKLHGIDLDSARKTRGNGFYYLCGDIARLHSAVLSYARDFMIDRGFTYYVPVSYTHLDVYKRQIQVCIDSAIDNLLVLTGEKATESVVNEIFSQFCVGK